MRPRPAGRSRCCSPTPPANSRGNFDELPKTAGVPILDEGGAIAMNPAAIDVDVPRFERLIVAGTAESLEPATGLYRGDLLEGFDLPEPAFEESLIPERERLREMAMDGLARLLTHQANAEGPEPAIQTALRLLALDPLQEATHRALMRLYARDGRRAAALRQYQLCVGVLHRELQVEPEAETQELFQAIVRQRMVPSPAPEVVRAARPRSPTTAPPRRRPAVAAAEPPLIGREIELDRLRRVMDEAWRGRGAGPGLLSVTSRHWLSWGLAERGEFTRALATAEEGLSIAESADQPYSLTVACLAAGYVALRKGAIDSALAVLERGLGLCRATPVPV